MPRLDARELVGVIIAATLMPGLTAGGGSPLAPPQENHMSSQVKSSASRVGQPALPPVSFEGKRYEQIMNGEREGLGQRTGLLSVIDLAAGTRAAVVKIYDCPRRPGLEADAGDVFFTRLQLDAAKREILIENERGQRFRYGIDDGLVRALN